MDRKYFKSPQEAVMEISKLLYNKEWLELSKYYDLQNSSIDKKDLESGNFFIRKDNTNVSLPISDIYKRPFNPAFKYDNHRTTKNGVTLVTVSIEIDQGDETVKKGFGFFKLKKKEGGLQILPDIVEAQEAFGDPGEIFKFP